MLSQFVFCARAGYLAQGTQRGDEGEEAEWLRPNLDYSPDYELSIVELRLRRELNAVVFLARAAEDPETLVPPPEAFCTGCPYGEPVAYRAGVSGLVHFGQRVSAFGQWRRRRLPLDTSARRGRGQADRRHADALGAT